MVNIFVNSRERKIVKWKTKAGGSLYVLNRFVYLYRYVHMYVYGIYVLYFCLLTTDM